MRKKVTVEEIIKRTAQMDDYQQALIEVSYAMESMTSKKAPGHKATILPAIMSLATSASSVYLGDQLANRDGKTPRIDIEQPCLCLYGMTTSERFYGSLSSVNVADGLIPRLVIFETLEDDLPELRFNVYEPPPVDLVRKVSAYECSNLIDPKHINPMVVHYDQGVLEALRKASVRYDKRANENKGDMFDALWTRVAVTVSQVALIVEDGPMITRKTFDWAVELVETLAENLVSVLTEKVVENEFQRNRNKLLKHIRQAGEVGVGRRALLRKNPSLRSKEFGELLDSLLQAGHIEQLAQGTSGRPLTVYRALH